MDTGYPGIIKDILIIDGGKVHFEIEGVFGLQELVGVGGDVLDVDIDGQIDFIQNFEFESQ